MANDDPLCVQIDVASLEAEEFATAQAQQRQTQQDAALPDVRDDL